ncbi:MarC family protein [Streptomyces sp. Je 1-369]|uniref:MarC family protein n=1 Tax=Streptomyces sp. Je 1-369 TaxID=2966192 RepID=UPI002286308A|nr:MarC family protein [Streptomyces sp. Je 1-369]WAL96735.1 hypothetical protein NOO62_20950 [Streptomyces sp. Je 1-369]
MQDAPPHDRSERSSWAWTEASGPDAPDPVSGVRQLLMPYVVSPLAMTAVLIEGAARDSWTWRSTVVGAYVTVIVVDLLCVVVPARILSRTHHATIELLGRLLGLLLAAVGVDLVLDGLTSLGVPADRGGH